MDEIKTRLQETSENCFIAYEAWTNDNKNSDLQEKLQDAVHELRKVASRLEIEMAVNERSNVRHEMVSESNHRSNNRGNSSADEKSSGSPKPKGRRSSAPRKPREKKAD